MQKINKLIISTVTKEIAEVILKPVRITESTATDIYSASFK